MANDVLAMVSTKSEGERIHENVAKFEFNSAKAGIDNRCSACISHGINDFEVPVTKIEPIHQIIWGTKCHECLQVHYCMEMVRQCR